MALDALGDRPLHLSYDIDACDPCESCPRAAVACLLHRCLVACHPCAALCRLVVRVVSHPVLVSCCGFVLLCSTPPHTHTRTHAVIAPHTGTAVRGGLTFREAHYVAEAVAETARLGSMDLVEVNPKLGSKAGDVLSQSTGEATVELGLMLITSAMGNRML